MSKKKRKDKRRQPKASKPPSGRRLDQLHAALTEALTLKEQGRLPEAAVLLTRALTLDPQYAPTLQHLALLKNELGQTDDAITLLRRSLQFVPKDPVCQNNLGNMLRAQGKLEEALQAYKAALALDPNYVNALFNIGTTVAQADFIAPEQALGYLERVAKLAPEDVQNWEAIGKVQSRLQRPEAAQKAFQTALDVDPTRAEACSGLGSVAVTQGNVEEARTHFRRALELQPGHPHALEYLARSRKYSVEDMAEIERTADMLRDADDEEIACVLHFTLGKMYDDCAFYDKAFEHYHAGNQIRLAKSTFDPQAIVDEVTSIIEVFSAEFFEQRRDFGSTTELPVLIVGPPRSGTTLVEQIIASHSMAAGAGEVPFLNDLVVKSATCSTLGFPRCFESIDRPTSVLLANEYLTQLEAACPNMSRVTDKAISGGLHLGLLAVMFPRARVVYCQRDLLSVGLSIYFQRFVKGTVPFAYDLRSIGIYCNQYARLMVHWLDVLPLDIHKTEYEAMVGNQEPMTRALIEYCGLPWEDQCLNFFETKRSVHTASHWQVRQPIYNHSVNRAESYGDFISALREEVSR